MQMNETSRFLFLTLGLFCLTLGAAVLLFSLIERVFFAMGFVGLLVGLAFLAIAFGTLLLLLGRRRSV